MGVLLLLSQERWQKFVSFGFDHIISGFCYLIRQKFKLTSFSLACFRVSCTVWSGFGNFSMEERKGNLCLGAAGGRKESHLPEPLGLHLLPRKDLPWNQVTWTLRGLSSGAGRRRTWLTVASSCHRAERETGRCTHSHFCVQVPLTLYSGRKHIVRLSKSHLCRPSLNSEIAQLCLEVHANRMCLYLFIFFLSMQHSLQR